MIISAAALVVVVAVVVKGRRNVRTMKNRKVKLEWSTRNGKLKEE
jgi:hypothetical protein